MILISKYLLPKGYNGLAIYPFVVLKRKALKFDELIVNHEKIHLRQQIELLIFPFYIWYAIEFVIKLIIYKNWHLAYHNISFEREAYRNESKPDYLVSRRYGQFLNYMNR